MTARFRCRQKESLAPVDQAQARAQLESAFDAFFSEGEMFGQMRSKSSIIDMYFFETLSVVLGIAPSPAAEALAHELREGSAAR